MDNFKLRHSELQKRKQKLDDIEAGLHYKVIQVGSGESGYTSFSLLKRLRHFIRNDTLLISEAPVHRPRYGQAFYALHNYERIDFEVPLVKSFKYENMVFDQIIEIDLERKRIGFLGHDFFTYDYLMLNCGRQVDYKGIEILKEKIDLKDNFYYAVDDFNSFEKMREDFEYFHNGSVFNLVIQKNADGYWQLISMAFMLRHIFGKADVNLYIESDKICEFDAINDKLTDQLNRNNIAVHINSKLYIDGNIDNFTIKLNDTNNVTDDVIIFALNKKIPDFLTQANFSIENFDRETLQHKEHRSIFSSGSLFYPNLTLGEKYRQVRTQIENFDRAVDNEWYSRNKELLRYKRSSDVLIHKTFDHISMLYGNGANDGLINAKLRSLRYLNIDLVKYMYILPRGWLLKGLFR